MAHPFDHPPTPFRRVIVWAAALLFAIVAWLALRPLPVPPTPIVETPAPIIVSDFTVPIGLMHKPLPYRIVSFHRGRADKNLIKLAAQLGFNGVQFQIEGSTEKGIQDFAIRDAREHLVDYCHSLGMKVTVWVHEMSDLPTITSRDYLGPVTATNDRLFTFLEARYERILSRVIPHVDGLVLTVVETQVRATDTQVMLRLSKMLAEKCQQHKKSLMVRTFVWTPAEFADVMEAIGKLPPETVIMSKVVPQDWQMRGGNAPEIGAVGGRPQIVEYDACGEYFLKSTVANCMVDLLKRQFDYGLTKGVQGICVRVDRDDSSVLFGPNEVNLWALGLMAAGVTDKTDDIWAMWANFRYGKEAGPLVVKALKGTAEVVTEMLSVGPFTYGDTRKPPALPDDADILLSNWQNWRWDPAYLPAYWQAAKGEAGFVKEEGARKAAAMKVAEDCLTKLEAAREKLPTVEYEILRTKLVTNQVQLAARWPMVMAMLEFNAANNAKTEEERRGHWAAMEKEIGRVRAVAATLGGEGKEVEYLGRKWQVWGAEGISAEDLEGWAQEGEEILEGVHIPASSLRKKTTSERGAR